MKKTLRIFLLALLCLCMVCCSENSETRDIDSSLKEGAIQETDLRAVTSLYSPDLPDGDMEAVYYRDGSVEVTLLDDNNQVTLYRINIETGKTETFFVGDRTDASYRMGNDGQTLWRMGAETHWIDKENYQADVQHYFELLNQSGETETSVMIDLNLYPRTTWLVDENNGIWCVAIDFGAGLDSKLYHFTADGTMLLDVGSTEVGVDFSSINDMLLLEDGTLLILTDDSLSFWKDDAMVAQCEAGSGSLISTCDMVYWAATGIEDSLFLIDLEKRSIGQALSSLYGASYVFAGGNAYDCILVTGEKVLGLDIGVGATELYDSPVTNMTLLDFICAIDEDTLLMSTYSGLTYSHVLTQIGMMDENSVPEKNTLILATVSGSTQFSCFDEWISYYNQHSTEYQVQVVEYEDEATLALALSTGEQIDILAWGAESGFYTTCQQRGYLKNLNELNTAGEILSDLIPAYRVSAEESDGGLYRLSSTITLSMLVGRREYAGAGNLSSSTLSDMGDNLKDGMYLMEGGWETALRSFLSLNQFVDYENASCNFTCQEFYDLLALIRDQFTKTGQVQSDVGEWISDRAAIQAVAINDIYSYWLEPLAENEFSVLSLNDLGVKVLFDHSYSILETSTYPEAAWGVIQVLLSSGFQRHSLSLPVSQSALENQFNTAITNENITIAEADQLRSMLEGSLYLGYTDEAIFEIVYEEAQSCFSGDKSPENAAGVIQSRVSIYLAEQS